VCGETANRVGCIQHRHYGWPGGFARLWSRRAGGELGTSPPGPRRSPDGSARPRPGCRTRARRRIRAARQNDDGAADDPWHPGHSGRQHHHTTSSAKCLSHGSSSALVIGTVVRGTPVPRYALSCWQGHPGQGRGRGTPLVGGLAVRSGYEYGQQTRRSPPTELNSFGVQTPSRSTLGQRLVHCTPAHIRQVGARLRNYGASNTSSLTLHLLISLDRPALSGSASTSRLRQGRLPPSPALPGSGCPQLHQAAATTQRGWSLTTPRHTQRPVARTAPPRRKTRPA